MEKARAALAGAGGWVRTTTYGLRNTPGGRRAKFRVVANDGLLTGAATSKGRHEVEAKAPRVSILSPANGDAVVEKTPVQFAASIEDLQDANLRPRKIVWRSSIQGAIGRGSTITAELEPGSHRITVRATNSAGRTGTASLDLEVAAVPPTVDALLIP